MTGSSCAGPQPGGGRRWDVIVVGGGQAGLAIAWHLARQGLRFVVLPELVSREEWLAARQELLVKEKAVTRSRDRVNADRRRLPMVRIDKSTRQLGRRHAS